MKKFMLFLFIVGSIAYGAYLMLQITSRETVPDVSAPVEEKAANTLEKIDTSADAGIDAGGIMTRFGRWLDTSRDDTSRGGETPENVIAAEAEESAALEPVKVATNTRQFVDDFSGDRILEEDADADQSLSEHWWLSSGGYMITRDGVGTSIHDSLGIADKWFLRYASGPSAALSDGGLHPQNVFRFVQRDAWQNLEQEVFFRIDRQILSEHPDRGASNGFFLFNRYRDADNLYAVGFRVDGKIVIKKKLAGVYTTLFESALVEGDYDAQSDPLLLPMDTWIGIRSVLRDTGGGRVNIKVYADIGRSGNWEIVGSVTDSGQDDDGEALTGSGRAGLRSDFMDVSFDDYAVREL